MSSRRANISAAANAVALRMTGRGEREVMRLPISKIRRDGGTQPRAGIDPSIVAEYAEVLAGGGTLPAAEVVYDGQSYWLWDGYHRLAAAESVGETEYDAYVTSGTRRDAVLKSVGANADHGLRRTNEDKRRAVETLLRDPEWSQWSDREIARQCKVSNQFVSNLRKELSVNGGQMRVVRRGDQVYKQDVSGIRDASQRRAEADHAAKQREIALAVTRVKQREIAYAVTRVMLDSGREMTHREIAVAVDKYLGHVVDAGLFSGVIAEMMHDGRLRSVGRGHYALPEVPEKTASDNGYQMDEPEPASDWLDRALQRGEPVTHQHDADLAEKLGEFLRVGEMVAGHLEMVLDRPGPLPEWLLIKLNELQALLYGRASGDADIYDPGLTQLLDDLYTKHLGGKRRGK